MQTIPYYIAYLLTKHECVILPGLGAFVVSGQEESKDKKAGLLCPPGNFLGFNPDIRHNDGLLANAIATGENISYKEACSQMHRYIDQITECMAAQTPIQMLWIGKLELSAERKILFTPSIHLSCNVRTFGMPNFYMPSVYELKEQEKYATQTEEELEQTLPDTSPKSPIRRYLAIAATIIGLLMIAIPVNDHSVQQSQMATIISLPTFALSETEVIQPMAEGIAESTEVSIEEPATAAIEASTEELVEEPAKEITPYYIVVASLPTEHSAQTQVAQFQKEGFSTVGVISNGNKHRIYIAKFSDKTEANTFLTRFRTEHPKYSDAWLCIQRI